VSAEVLYAGHTSSMTRCQRCDIAVSLMKLQQCLPKGACSLNSTAFYQSLRGCKTTPRGGLSYGSDVVSVLLQ
jgi:hypothetical protein